MRLKFFLLMILLATVPACDQTPEQVYTTPVLSGKAYVLAVADHIAVVDLSTTDLSRIKMDKQGVDLALVGKQLYVLAEDGTLASLAGNNTLTPWQDGLPGAVAMIAAKDNTLWLLSSNKLRQFIPGQGLGKTIPLNGSYSSLFLGEKPDSLWLVSRKESSVSPFNLATSQVGAAIASIGNSVHRGRSFPGTNELWLAEGNEYMNGEPYGVGYATDKPAMPGGINVIDIQRKIQSDFIIVGGNVVDLIVSPDREQVYAATSQLPDYDEATLAVVTAKSRRVTAELRLCFSCHQEANIRLKRGAGQVRAMAIAWPEKTK